MCDTCPRGYYCTENTTNPYDFPCPVGHYCPAGTRFDTEYPCPQGTYNPDTMTTNSSACLYCPPGEYCEGTGRELPSGNCSEGWFCTGGAHQSEPIVLGESTLSGGTCYFPTEKQRIFHDEHPRRCDCTSVRSCSFLPLSALRMLAGNYTDIDVCMCPANNYTGGRCHPGTYCPSGSSAPVLCIAGQYCEDYELPLPNGACAPQRHVWLLVDRAQAKD